MEIVQNKGTFKFFQDFRRRLNIKIHVVEKNPRVFKLVPKLKIKSKFEAPAYFKVTGKMCDNVRHKVTYFTENLSPENDLQTFPIRKKKN